MEITPRQWIAIRNHQDWDQATAARKVGIDIKTLVKFEKGRDVHPSVVERIVAQIEKLDIKIRRDGSIVLAP